MARSATHTKSSRTLRQLPTSCRPTAPLRTRAQVARSTVQPSQWTTSQTTPNPSSCLVASKLCKQARWNSLDPQASRQVVVSPHGASNGPNRNRDRLEDGRGPRRRDTHSDTIGVYALARFTKVLDAYAEERAKLLAQFHNLDKLVEQTKTLTAMTETIKARVSDEVWDRQMRWTAKRDMYVKLVECLSDLVGAATMLMVFEEAHQDTESELADVKRLAMTLVKLTDIAPLVLSDRATKILKNLRKHFGGELWTKEHIEVLKAHLEIFMREAKKDLGYDEPAADSDDLGILAQ